MRIGVISDIHSNIIALKEVVKQLEEQKCDEYFLLGDFVSDTPYTRYTMDYLYDFINSHKCHILRGNREEYMLSQRNSIKENKLSDKWKWNSASGNLLFAYQELNEDDFDFFDKLPITFTYSKDGYPSITCCHGSPSCARELLQLNDENTIKWLRNISTDYLICAHTHFPGAMTYEGKQYFNPGCIGISINDVGNAQCMIIEAVNEKGFINWKPFFMKVKYDYNRVVEDIFKSGLYNKAPWFVNSNVHTFITGIDLSSEMVMLAKELNEKSGNKAGWPNIDEVHFKEASRLLNIPDYSSFLKH